MLTTFLVVINFNYGSKWKLFVYVVFDIKHEMRRAALVALQQKQHRDESKCTHDHYIPVNKVFWGDT